MRRQAAIRCASGHRAGLGRFPDLGRESIGPPCPRAPCSDRVGGGAGSRSRRAPRAAGAMAEPCCCCGSMGTGWVTAGGWT